MTHPLHALLDGVALGEYPPNDWNVEVLPPLDGRCEVIAGFTGHCVLTGAFADKARAHIAATDPSTAMKAPFLAWIAEQLGSGIGTYDALLLARGTGAGAPGWAERVDTFEHPRVERARRYRPDAQIYCTNDRSGLFVLGHGLCDRWEVAFEVEPHARGQGLGRRLAAAARGLVPNGEAVWAQVAPGNAASMRSTIAAGFWPVGSEVLFPRGAQ
jgi:GNAT superfamily N-acetyltransferase